VMIGDISKSTKMRADHRVCAQDGVKAHDAGAPSNN
jgi:hypothetical protein